MNKILSIDTDNWFVVIEPGVTYEQLQNELSTHNLRAMIPLGVPPQRTVLSSILERDPALAAASFEYGNDLMLDTEIILPEGELFRTGLWASGGRPGAHLGPVRALLYRFWTAAQGTLGIMTKMALQVEYLPQQQEILFLPFSSLNDSLETIKQIQKKEIGLECFL
jgi:FAD/FMN-containing dehydrogenase